MAKLAVHQLVENVHSSCPGTVVVQELVHSSQFMIFNPSLRRRLDLKHAHSYESLACIVEDRDDEPVLRRSNSVDSRSSTLKSHTEGDYDSDLDIQQEYEAWSYLHERATESMDIKDVKRQDVISEFIHTERTHVRNLTLLRVAYANPLKDKQILSPEVADRIFINIEELQRLHRNFSKKLRDLQKQNLYVKEIGQCILDVMEKPNFSKAHIKYCTNISDSLMVLKGKMKSPDFAEFLLQCESNPKCRRMHLKELLPGPFQRITKYPLLLNQIQKYTPPDTPEHALLTKCLERIKAICQSIDSNVAKAEGLRIEKAVRSRLLAENLHLQLGEVIINMPLHWLTDDKLLFVNAVLFESVLVFLAGEKAADDKMITKIELTTVHLCRRDQADLKKLYIISIANNEANMYTVNCQNVDAANSLHDALNELVNKDKVPVSSMELIEREDYTERVRSASSRPNSMEEQELETDGQVIFRNNDKEERTTIEQHIQQKDAEILTLLRHKVELMKALHNSKLPRGTRDVITALNQLTTDTKTLHKVSSELLDSYTGADKNEKSIQLNQAFTSSISNIETVLRVSSCESSEEGEGHGGELTASGPMRRASMFFANKFSRSKDDLVIELRTAESRKHKKYQTKQRSHTQSPMRLSPKSSNESLNKVTSCRHSTCSHQSTDSECDVDMTWTNAKPPITPIKQPTPNSSAVARGKKNNNKNSGLFNFRKSQYIASEEHRPVITEPVLQHTTNASVSSSSINVNETIT